MLVKEQKCEKVYKSIVSILEVELCLAIVDIYIYNNYFQTIVVFHIQDLTYTDYLKMRKREIFMF